MIRRVVNVCPLTDSHRSSNEFPNNSSLATSSSRSSRLRLQLSRLRSSWRSSPTSPTRCLSVSAGLPPARNLYKALAEYTSRSVIPFDRLPRRLCHTRTRSTPRQTSQNMCAPTLTTAAVGTRSSLEGPVSRRRPGTHYRVCLSPPSHQCPNTDLIPIVPSRASCQEMFRMLRNCRSSGSSRILGRALP